MNSVDNEPSLLDTYYHIRNMTNVREIESIISNDRAYSAYALGHLEKELFRQSKFYLSESKNSSGIVMHSTGLGNTSITIGDSKAISAILSIYPGNRQSYLVTASETHLPILKKYYHVEQIIHMQRMTVNNKNFTPQNGQVEKLTGTHINALNLLYRKGGGPYFSSSKTVDQGVYFGIFNNGSLVAAGGSHVVAPNQQIAVVGNIFTDLNFRGKGYATYVTSAITQQLLNYGCAEVVLSVNPENIPAVSAYKRLGFDFKSHVTEAKLKRKDSIGLRMNIRRQLAKRKGHTNLKSKSTLLVPLGDG
ncbi:MAG: hypothetical protein CL792_03735 [Chloroflexi bacterium]|nr:hypothetical protein [Chloroflexota bacterium]|tara:strand:+ start:14434 stop:15348 length:915 start_codon:yes stop_codon:yes gene_type:complete